MNLMWMCLKIFSARILDVTIGTVRTVVMMKDRVKVATILAFLEVMIWFIVAREALLTAKNTWWIAVSYSLGFATGTWLGSFLSKKFVRGITGVQVISKKDVGMIEEIQQNGFGISVVKVEGDKNYSKKQLLIIEIDSRSLDTLTTIVRRHDEKAFVIVNDTKFVVNGFIK